MAEKIDENQEEGEQGNKVGRDSQTAFEVAHTLQLKNKVLDELKKDGFPDLKFLFSPEVLEVSIDIFTDLLAEEKKQFDALLLKDIEALEFADFEFSRTSEYFYNLIYHFKSCRQTERNTSVLGEIDILNNDFEQSMLQSGEYYTRVCHALIEVCENDDQRRVLEIRKQRLEQNGVHLTPEEKAQKTPILQSLSELSQKYMTQLTKTREETSFYFEDASSLTYLPEHITAEARNVANSQNKTGYVFLFTIANEQALLKFCDDGAVRKQVFLTGITLAAHNNETLALEMVQHRSTLAQIGGGERYSDISFATKMAESPDKVEELYDAYAQECMVTAQELITHIQDHFGLEDLREWDYGYYLNLYIEQTIGVSEKELQPYRKYENVIEGIFRSIESVYGVKFELTDITTYSEDVQVYSVSRGGKKLGYYMPDFFAHPGKRPGGWAEALKTSTSGEKIMINVANLSKSESGDNYLSGYDIRVVFHELGHMLHEFLSPDSYSELSGFEVEADAIEIPSKFTENLILDPNILPLYLRHESSGEPIGEDLCKKIIEASKIGKEISLLNAVGKSLFDLDIHGLESPKTVEELHDISYSRYRQYSPFNILLTQEEYKIASSFYHLFHSATGTYVAGYYSYIWSDILQEKIWNRIQDTGGVFESPVMKKYIERMLSQGARKPSMELYEDVMSEHS